MTTEITNNVTPEMTKGIKGFQLCAFLIGLEGWRRGLTLKYYVDIHRYSDIRTQGKKLVGRNYSLASKDKTHYFNQSRGDLVNNEAVRIAQSKQETKEYLIKKGVATLPSIEFRKKDSDDTIIQKAHEIGYPVIVKPTYGTLSKGVVLNIQNEQQLVSALKKVRYNLGYKSIILEKYFDGDDIRLYVVNGKVVAALKRVPATLIGDGKSNIRKLIKEKNKSRESNPYLSARPIKIDAEVHEVLEEAGYNLESVLNENEKLRVKYKSTMDQGVDLYDITEEIQNHVKQLAIDSLDALPDIVHGSIDMLYDGNNAVVIEVNPSANISMHMFPTEGKPRSIGKHLMDFYFPETEGKAEVHGNMYFDYMEVIDILKRNFTNYIEVETLPNNKIHAKLYIISGTVQKVGFRKWARRQAILKNLNGYAMNKDNGDIEILVAGRNEDVNKFYELCLKGPKRAKVAKIKSYDWDGSVKIGFEI